MLSVTRSRGILSASALFTRGRTFYTALDKTKQPLPTMSTRNPRVLDAINPDYHAPGFYHQASVVFTNNHTTGTVEYHEGQKFVSASTKEKVFDQLYSTRNISAAYNVGRLLGLRLQNLGIVQVHLNLNGKKFHGRSKAFAEGLQTFGISFKETLKGQI
eukprot:CFRG1749T1